MTEQPFKYKLINFVVAPQENGFTVSFSYESDRLVKHASETYNHRPNTSKTYVIGTIEKLIDIYHTALKLEEEPQTYDGRKWKDR